MNKLDAVKSIYKSIDDKLGIDIKVLDVREISSLADYFVIASANNSNQLRALTDTIEENLYKETGLRIIHSEGLQTKNWVLLDFGDIVVHLFDKEQRDFYNIEHLWSDAKIVPEELLKS